MAVAASGLNTKILQFDWLISGRTFLVLPAQGRDLIKPYSCRIKLKFLTTYEVKIYYEQSEKEK